jgi:hypothetical protein
MQFLILAASVALCPANLDRQAEQARPAPPEGVSGSLVSVSAQGAIVQTKTGAQIPIALTKGWTISVPRKGSLGDLKIGQFVGTANLGVDAGRGKAQELRVFEPGYVPEFGTHQLTQPAAGAAGATGAAMTHGFIFGLRAGQDGVTLDLFYPGGCRSVELSQSTPITVFEALPMAAATPGREVSAVLRADAAGNKIAGRLTTKP